MDNTTELLPDLKLRFNIEHPSLEECYLFGYECAQAEMNEEDNPFCENTSEYDYWLEGWWAGFYEEKPLFQNEGENVAAKKPSHAANEESYHFISSLVNNHFLVNVLKITGALAATAMVGYQVLELVA